MGKAEDDEFSLSSTAAAEAASRIEANRRRGDRRCCGCNCCFSFSGFVKLKCILALLLGISVFISALFWLPPFSKLSDPGDKDLDPRFRGHMIVASFQVQKPVSFVKENVSQLDADIYYEVVQTANAKIVIISLEGSKLNTTNTTNVVFGIDHLSKWSRISVAELSLIRSSFASLVTRQAKFHLTTSVFGDPSFFEVLKFPGGITVNPVVNVYPLQQVQISFNFTLNNSILQIQENFEVLVNQLKSGLHLASEEILYILLTNSRGSTVAPPTTIQASVVLTIGVPSVPRMKQLAKTIKDSPARNLGLNNTVFGKVKQISLSSVLPTSGASSPTPAPAPGPLPHYHHHHHHHHHHQHHDRGAYFPPATTPSYPPARAPQPVEGSPAPVRGYHALPPRTPMPATGYQASPHGAPAPFKSYQASPPGCKFGFKGRHSGRSPEHTPTHAAVSPSMSYHHSAASPHRQALPPVTVAHQISPFSPLPNVIYARAHPPLSGSGTYPEPPDKVPSVAPWPSAGGRNVSCQWILAVLVALLLLP